MWVPAAGILLHVLPLASAAETVIGVYAFHRHGDRTPKILPPTTLTDLGYRQVYTSGQYYRDRYIAADAPRRISGISEDIVDAEQVLVSAPVDTVLQDSATGFLQGLYPPVGPALSTSTLADGSTVTAPMNGYQLIPVNIVETGAGSEDSGWLQDSTACANAETSSNAYFYSDEYNMLNSKTMGFYHSLLPAISGVFNRSTANYLNAYTIFDYINVGTIHNATVASGKIVNEQQYHQLLTLANEHEFNLAYNRTWPIRAIAGMQLAAEIVDFFKDAISTGGENKIGIQFGAYATFQSFFGLSDLTAASESFYGIPDYASAMLFELYTDADFKGFPRADQLRVRFYFHNGTTSADSEPQGFPLFGQPKMSLGWEDFATRMGRFSVGTTEKWCHMCGNTTGTCAPFAHLGGQAGSSESGDDGGISNAVAGVIGAMVTLAVILLAGCLLLFCGGVTVVSKKRLLQSRRTANGDDPAPKA